MIERWENVSQRKTFIYYCDDEIGLSKPIEDSDIRIFYECLKSSEVSDNIDILLYTTGGFISPARRLALLLRDYAKHIRMIIPYKARSVGTLLALSASQLLLLPLAELSPLDPQNSKSNISIDNNLPSMISSEDVRHYKSMAKSWFDIEDSTNIFLSLAQKFFPTSLTQFYRSTQLIEEISFELIRYQLPDVPEQSLNPIINKLLYGYHSHDYIITRQDACDLGLNTVFATQEEEDLLWEMFCSYSELIKNSSSQSDGRFIFANGLIASTTFSAIHIMQGIPINNNLSNKTPRDSITNTHPSNILKGHWKVDR